MPCSTSISYVLHTAFFISGKKDFTAPRMKVLRNEHLLGPLPVCLSNAGVRENALRLQALHGPGKMFIHLYVSGKLTTNP